VECNNGDVRK